MLTGEDGFMWSADGAADIERSEFGGWRVLSDSSDISLATTVFVGERTPRSAWIGLTTMARGNACVFVIPGGPASVASVLTKGCLHVEAAPVDIDFAARRDLWARYVLGSMCLAWTTFPFGNLQHGGVVEPALDKSGVGLCTLHITVGKAVALKPCTMGACEMVTSRPKLARVGAPVLPCAKGAALTIPATTRAGGPMSLAITGGEGERSEIPLWLVADSTGVARGIAFAT